jgi:curved DNA-binding protein CbpA
MEDLYKILGVARNASPEDIRKAYRTQAKDLHPDVNRSPDAQKKFQALNEANIILSDPDKRAKYDRTGSTTPEGKTSTQNPNQPRDINEWMDQMFKQTHGVSWEQMMGGKQTTPKSQSDQIKRDEDKRKLQEEELKRQVEFKEAEENRIRQREQEIRQKNEFSARVDKAWQERLANLSFGERAKRMVDPNWDWKENNMLRQKMEKEDKLKDLENQKSTGKQKINDIKEELTKKQEDIKPMTDWKKPNEPEVTSRRKIDLGPEHHTVGRKPPRDFNPGGENKG